MCDFVDAARAWHCTTDREMVSEGERLMENELTM